MRTITLIFLSLLFIAVNVLANGFDSYNAATAKSSSAKQCATPIIKKTIKRFPKKRYTPPPLYSVVLFQGSLKHNIVRIAHNYGWDTVVWNATEDYLWVGTTHVTGKSLQEIFSKILVKYPLQAQFYNGNRVLAIVPRNTP